MQCSVRAVVENVLTLILIVICVIMWLVHSQLYLWKFNDQAYDVISENMPANEIVLPAVVFCNKEPLNRIKVNQQQDEGAKTNNFRKYIDEMLNPEVVNEPGYDRSTQTVIQGGEQSFKNMYDIAKAQGLNGRNKLQSMMYTCNEILASCQYKDDTRQLADQCCQQVNPMVATTRGLCMVYNNTRQMQTMVGAGKGYKLWFRMDNNAFRTTGVVSHPGIDIYLVDPEDPVKWRALGSLSNPTLLNDSMGILMTVQKEVVTRLYRAECGVSRESARLLDIGFEMAMKKNEDTLKPLPLCLLQKVVDRCNCHPLFSEFLNLDNTYQKLNRSIAEQTQPCTYEQTNNCAKPYLDLLKPSLIYSKDPPGTEQLKDDFKECVRKTHRPCHYTNYVGTPAPYQIQDQSADFNAELEIAFKTMTVKSTVEKWQMNIFELLSYIGFCGALWFTIGHIIWSVIRFFTCNLCCKKEDRVVSPEKEKMNQGQAELYQQPPPQPEGD